MATSGPPSSPETRSEAAADGDTSTAGALLRLNKALDSLEQAVDVSIETRGKELNTDEQIQRMTEDRAKLARQLDEAEAKVVGLKDVNNEVSRRLVGAMEMVRGVLDKQS